MVTIEEVSEHDMGERNQRNSGSNSFEVVWICDTHVGEADMEGKRERGPPCVRRNSEVKKTCDVRSVDLR